MTRSTPSTDLAVPVAAQRGGLANIQALRALAAALVVVVHLELLARPLGLARIDTEMFAAGVDLFFVISGFIMVYTTTRRTPTPWRFLLNRIARIAPFYWLLTIAVFAIALVAPAAMGGTRATLPNLLRSLLFIPYPREDGLLRPILFVGWSLNLEMLFYLIFALALLLPRPAPRVVAGVAVLAAMILAGRAGHGAIGPVAAFLTQPILLEFALGMLIGLGFDRLPATRGWARAAALAVAPLIVAMLVLARWPVPGGWPLTAIPAGLAIAAALVAERGGLAVRARWIAVLGDASYALYLTHPLVTQGVGKVAARLHLLAAATAPLWMLAALILAALVGVAAHLWVERPVSRRAHRLLLG